jgi:hypothetical protein
VVDIVWFFCHRQGIQVKKKKTIHPRSLGNARALATKNKTRTEWEEATNSAHLTPNRLLPISATIGIRGRNLKSGEETIYRLEP